MKLICSLAAAVALSGFGSSVTAGVAVGNPGKLVDRYAPKLLTTRSTTDGKGIVIIAGMKPAPPENGIFAGPIRLLDAGKGLTAGSLEHGPGLHDSVEPTSGPDFVEDDDCPNFMKDDDPGYPDPTRIERPVFGPHIVSF